MKKVWAELSENQKRIEVFFAYDREMNELAKKIPGGSLISPAKSGREVWFWQYKVDIRTARLLREAFPQMKLGKALKAWGYRAAAEERNLGSMAVADDAELKLLPELAPDVYEFIKTRNYQKADIAFMAEAGNPLNANAPGLGKTIEMIASVYESDTWNGPQLVLAPRTSLEVVWAAELLHDEHGQDMPVVVATGDRANRNWALQQAVDMYENDQPFWLIANPQMAQVRFNQEASDKANREVLLPIYPQLFDIEWNNIIIDEFHKCGMGNPKTITRKGLTRLNGRRRTGSSGTPMGGKAVKLWGVLNWLEPDRFPSKWKWVKQWFITSESSVHVGRGEYKDVIKVGEIKPGLEEQFYKEHARYMVRRTKKEVRAELPDTVRIDVWCTMDKEQEKQYRDFEKKAELKIEEEELNAIGILAEYTRLRQFAIAKQRLVRDMKTGVSTPYPTEVSCKLDQVMRILGEHGVQKFDESEDTEAGSEQVVIFSQFSRVVDMVCDHLNGVGITATKLTGQTSDKDRARIVQEFEARTGPQVLCMTTTAGGVAITLNQSEAIIIMDETWVPDDQIQAEERNRENTAVIYYIRTKGTIEEYVLQLNLDKRNVNDLVLDIHRMRLKAMALA